MIMTYRALMTIHVHPMLLHNPITRLSTHAHRVHEHKRSADPLGITESSSAYGAKFVLGGDLADGPIPQLEPRCEARSGHRATKQVSLELITALGE
jgi:hypothetical protein